MPTCPSSHRAAGRTWAGSRGQIRIGLIAVGLLALFVVFALGKSLEFSDSAKPRETKSSPRQIVETLRPADSQTTAAANRDNTGIELSMTGHGQKTAPAREYELPITSNPVAIDGVLFSADLVNPVPGTWVANLDAVALRYGWEAGTCTADCMAEMEIEVRINDRRVAYWHQKSMQAPLRGSRKFKIDSAATVQFQLVLSRCVERCTREKSAGCDGPDSMYDPGMRCTAMLAKVAQSDGRILLRHNGGEL